MKFLFNFYKLIKPKKMKKQEIKPQKGKQNFEAVKATGTNVAEDTLALRKALFEKILEYLAKIHVDIKNFYVGDNCTLISIKVNNMDIDYLKDFEQMINVVDFYTVSGLLNASHDKVHTIIFDFNELPF